MPWHPERVASTCRPKKRSRRGRWAPPSPRPASERGYLRFFLADAEGVLSQSGCPVALEGSDPETDEPGRGAACQPPFFGAAGSSDESALYTPAPMIAPVMGARM